MKNIIKLLCLAFAVIALSSCEKDTGGGGEVSKPKQEFLAESIYGVYSTGDGLFVYSEATCQLYYSPTKHSSRVLKDNLTSYVEVAFAENITANATVKATVNIRGFSGKGFEDEDVNILKIENGKAWVWHETSGVGYLIPWDIK